MTKRQAYADKLVKKAMQIFFARYADAKCTCENCKWHRDAKEYLTAYRTGTK